MDNENFVYADGKEYVTMVDEDSIINIVNKSFVIPSDIPPIYIGEENSSMFTFEINRFHDGVDILDKLIKIVYKNSNGVYSDDACNICYSDKHVRFSWVIPYSFSQSQTNIMCVSITGKDELDNDYSLKTSTIKMSVGNSINISTSNQPNPNWFVSIEGRLTDVERANTITDEDIQNAVNIYMQTQNMITQSDVEDIVSDYVASHRDELAGTNGVDGYTPIKGIDYFDGANGKDGQDGVDGTNGKDGKDGTNGANGYSPTIEISKNGNVATITVTDINGENQFQISDGNNGTDGTTGENGEDGFSPIVSISKNEKISTVIITDVNGAHSFEISDGVDGTNGKDGADGASGIPTVVTQTSGTVTIQPNVLNMFGLVASLDITFGQPTDSTIANEYHGMFVTNNADFTFNFATYNESEVYVKGITEFKTGVQYEFSMVKNIMWIG